MFTINIISDTMIRLYTQVSLYQIISISLLLEVLSFCFSHNGTYNSDIQLGMKGDMKNESLVNKSIKLIRDCEGGDIQATEGVVWWVRYKSNALECSMVIYSGDFAGLSIPEPKRYTVSIVSLPKTTYLLFIHLGRENANLGIICVCLGLCHDKMPGPICFNIFSPLDLLCTVSLML